MFLLSGMDGFEHVIVLTAKMRGVGIMGNQSQKSWKRVLSLFLIFAMALSFVPAFTTPAMAADDTYASLKGRLEKVRDDIDGIIAKYGIFNIGDGYAIDVAAELTAYKASIEHDLAIAEFLYNRDFEGIKAYIATAGSNVNISNTSNGYTIANFLVAFPNGEAAALKYLQQGGHAVGKPATLSVTYFFAFKSKLNPSYTASCASTLGGGFKESGQKNIVDMAEAFINDFETSFMKPLKSISDYVSGLNELKAETEQTKLEAHFLEYPCTTEGCEYGEDCVDWKHRLLVPEESFNNSVQKFRDDIDRDIKIIGSLAVGTIEAGLLFKNTNAAALYADTNKTALDRFNAAISFVENGGYSITTMKLGLGYSVDRQIAVRSNFNSTYDVTTSALSDSATVSGESELKPLINGALEVLKIGASPDNLAFLYDYNISKVNEYKAEAGALDRTAVPEGGNMTLDEYTAAIDKFIANIERDLHIADVLKNGTVANDGYPSAWNAIEPILSPATSYKSLSADQKLANAIGFFNKGGYTLTDSLLNAVPLLEYKSSFHGDYSAGLFGVLANTANVFGIMDEEFEALQSGNKFLTELEKVRNRYNFLMDSLTGMMEDPTTLVNELIANSKDLESTVATLNTLLHSVSAITNILQRAEALGISTDVLYPLLEQFGITPEILESFLSLSDTLGIDLSGDASVEDAIAAMLENELGQTIISTVSGLITSAGSIVGGADNLTVYNLAIAILEPTYDSLTSGASDSLNNLIAGLMEPIKPLLPFVDLLSSGLDVITVVLDLAEAVQVVSEDPSLVNINNTVTAAANALDALAYLLESLDSLDIDGLLNGILGGILGDANIDLGSIIGIGDGESVDFVGMLVELLRGLLESGLGSAGIDLGAIGDIDLSFLDDAIASVNETILHLIQFGLNKPSALAPLLHTTANLLRSAANISGGIQNIIDGEYEQALNAILEGLTGMGSGMVDIWGDLSKLYKDFEEYQAGGASSASAAVNTTSGGMFSDPNMSDSKFISDCFSSCILSEIKSVLECLGSNKFDRDYKMKRLEEFKDFVNEICELVKRAGEMLDAVKSGCEWAKTHLTPEACEKFCAKLAYTYASKLKACIIKGIEASDICEIVDELESVAKEACDLVRFIMSTGELEIIATAGEETDDDLYSFTTNYDSLINKLLPLLNELGISLNYIIVNGDSAFYLDGNELMLDDAAELENGDYNITVAYELSFNLCHREFDFNLAYETVSHTVDNGEETDEPDWVLDSIEFDFDDVKKSYKVGDAFDLTSLKVYEVYVDQNGIEEPRKELTNKYSSSISAETILTLDDAGEVTITYTGDSAPEDHTGTFEITVTENEEPETETFIITFDPNGGSDVNDSNTITAEKTGEENPTITLPSTSRSGYDFLGWYDGDTLAGGVGEIYTVADDVTLMAKWQSNGGDEKTTFTVTFNSAGGSTAASVTEEENIVIKLPSTSRSGYSFLGWYDGNTRMGGVGSDYTVTKDVTLTARWSRNQNNDRPEIEDELPPLAGAFSFMYLPCDNPDGIVYYYAESGEKIYVPFCLVVDENIYFFGSPLLTYYVEPNPKNFSDVAGHWALENILAIASREVFVGYPDGSFQPQSTMTRAMFATVLARMAEADVSDFTDKVFDDVEPSAWYGPYVAWAYTRGLVLGKGNNMFDPDANITREEAAVMIDRFLDDMGIELESTAVEAFADAMLISSWATDAVNRAHECKIIEGKGNNVFDPQSNSTRAEISTMLFRLIRLSINYALDNYSPILANENI